MIRRSIIATTAAALAAFSLADAVPAQARLLKLQIISQQPYGTFKPGNYVLWEGRVVGELSPGEAIPDLEKATKNARGMVDYAARITLIMPADPGKGNGALLVDIPNRGRVYAQALYNSPRDEPFVSGTLEQGTGFLQDRGYSVAEVRWELGQGAELPSFVDTEGKTHYVEGVGFAIVRDAADFLARAAADPAGTPNPLKGAIGRTLASGKSQSGRYLKSFLLNGFNMVEGRRVFDGMHIFVSGAGLLPIMQSGTGPESSANRAPSFDNPEFRGVNEEPLTISEIIRRVEARGEVPPRIVMINTTIDYFSLRASLARTGAEGIFEHPFPANVRVYDIAGASHVVVPQAPDCKLTPAKLDWTPVSRATLLHLDRWVTRNIEPPTTRLMPLQPAADDPTVLRAPKHLPKALVEVPQRDADRNSLGGVRLPDLVVPLGVHGVQNQPPTFLCSLVGAFVPFAKTKEEREAAHDERLSIAERYRDRNDYATRIRVAARALEADGFLLPEDAAVIINSAAESGAFK